MPLGQPLRLTLGHICLQASVNQAAERDRNLFHAPPDLVCPITHDLFSDPVATAAGQVRIFRLLCMRPHSTFVLGPEPIAVGSP